MIPAHQGFKGTLVACQGSSYQDSIRSLCRLGREAFSDLHTSPPPFCFHRETGEGHGTFGRVDFYPRRAYLKSASDVAPHVLVKWMQTNFSDTRYCIVTRYISSIAHHPSRKPAEQSQNSHNQVQSRLRPTVLHSGAGPLVPPPPLPSPLPGPHLSCLTTT